MASPKPVHTIVLDAGPMLRNDPSISSLLAKADRLVTVSSVISEIRDANARSRVDNTWRPFLEAETPNPQSVKIISDFARRTGDLAVLSRSDIEVLALAYELECEASGPSQIRLVPGQKIPAIRKTNTGDSTTEANPSTNTSTESEMISTVRQEDLNQSEHHPASQVNEISETLNSLKLLDETSDEADRPSDLDPDDSSQSFPDLESSDSDGWITPSNIQKHQAKDQNTAIPLSGNKPVQVATITSDFAMQNVLLSMNLTLLNTSLQRVRNIKTFILRCHACFEKTKDMTKQFCPRCGKPTLTRVSCSTNSKGEFKIHLKKNMQWNHRGDRYSIPKPVSGAANGKVGQGKGGGQGGWGQNLILTEDQKEYVRAIDGRGRRRQTDLMDDDYLPSILTGDRGRAGGRPRIGAGRNVNAKKR